MSLMDDKQICEMLEVMADPVIVMGEDGKIALANGQAAILLGYGPDELIGLPVELIIPERFRDRHAGHLKAYLARPVIRPMGGNLNLMALCKDGREVPVDISISPLETTRGLLFVASIRDMSARDKAALELRSALEEVERLRDRLCAENVYLQDEVRSAYGFDEFVGKCDVLMLLLEKIDRVATTDANVLILGETGTGKELVARAIHQRSDRKDRPLIKVNCAALPRSLVDGALFGHEKGAYTGASTQEIGRFELADGGTILLDEIGDFDPEVQAKLLRVLQEGEFERVGSSKTRGVDVRVIAATNRDLHAAMQRGGFRPDLYFRLAVFPVEVPSLRARREDIPLLAWHFVSKKQAKLGKRIDKISQATMVRLTEYAWPGNIRELENVVERAMILSPDSTLIVEPLLDVVHERTSVPAAKLASVDTVMRSHILSVLQECHWRIKGPGAAAERLDVNPSTLRYRMKKLGIERP
ncbi:MAG: sigma 54-interacting transcriptional regulator [Planctomycetes bacterium]|nr:sigma 54-interacting transcriptional regulator [Planctomycetota bacterium]MBL7043190.1 sigma 54-interacting transcriptional regulator [Pirellulaceae bacterium]